MPASLLTSGPIGDTLTVPSALRVVTMPSRIISKIPFHCSTFIRFGNILKCNDSIRFIRRLSNIWLPFAIDSQIILWYIHTRHH